MQRNVTKKTPKYYKEPSEKKTLINKKNHKHQQPRSYIKKIEKILDRSQGCYH